MQTLDKHYLSLQFKNKIHIKKGTEFQSFFETIMEKAFADFQKIRPYGNSGDGGNDGFRKDAGIYYQAYAPNTPSIKHREAADKLKNDFEKLKINWDGISEVKEFFFVFNDQYEGSSIIIEEALSELKNINPGINFNVYLSKNLEKDFLALDPYDILDLGFVIDTTKAVSIIFELFQNVENELDKENAKLALKLLNTYKDIIFELKNESLSLEYGLLEGRCLLKFEKKEEAQLNFERIAKSFPNDPRPILYLASIYLQNDEHDKNLEFLDKAALIDDNFWLLKLEYLLRKYLTNEDIDTGTINENDFPSDNRIKANFYRIHALILEKQGDVIAADRFIDRAIELNPNRYTNHLVKLLLIENRVLSEKNEIEKAEKLDQLLEKVIFTESKLIEFGSFEGRNKAFINLSKINTLWVKKNYHDCEILFPETFSILLECYFDKDIDRSFVDLLKRIKLPCDSFKELLNYLDDSKKKISDELSTILIAQFNYQNWLISEGKHFFKKINNLKYFNFISSIENGNHEEVLNYLKNDVQLAFVMSNTFAEKPDLRKKIIDILPDNQSIDNDKILFFLYYDEGDFDKAFNILKTLSSSGRLSGFDYLECKSVLEVVQKQQAWDFEIIFLEKLLSKEKEPRAIHDLKLQLFNANLHLKKTLDIIRVGEDILKEDSQNNFLSSYNKENILYHVIHNYQKREEFDKARGILERFNSFAFSPEFKIDVEADVYINNNEPQKALEAVINAVKFKKNPSDLEYAKIYFKIAIEIAPLLKLNLDTLKIIVENTFVKFKNNDHWYFIGDDNELDAIPINKSNEKYSCFINKENTESIIFTNKYRSENKTESIDLIYSIEQYILWKASVNLHKLTNANVMSGVQVVDVPAQDQGVDLQYLKAFFEDSNKDRAPFFDNYCSNNLPLALLALSEGGLTNAIGRIQTEQKGFINFCSGTQDEIMGQRTVAEDIIKNELSFYIDGTSAIVLSETGLLKKILLHLPNLMVPQTVINLIDETINKFRENPRQVGYMRYVKGELNFSQIDQVNRKLIRSNFIESRNILETKSVNTISLANKYECFAERDVPAELCDACILAQKEKIPVLTEDFLYLLLNELQTKKDAPKYFSSILLIRVLYEQGKIDFDEYLNFFSYLSSYRFRFLSLGPDDLIMAVFGEGKIKCIKPDNIRKLNLSLTLSEEYGVSFQAAFEVLECFLLEVIMDNTVLADIADRIFIEVIESFPANGIDKRSLGQMLLSSCMKKIEDNKSDIVLISQSDILKKKINSLLRLINIYKPDKILTI